MGAAVVKRQTIAEIQAKRLADNRSRKIAAYVFSFASLPTAAILWLMGASLFEQISAGLLSIIVAELLDINIALRGGE